MSEVLLIYFIDTNLYKISTAKKQHTTSPSTTASHYNKHSDTKGPIPLTAPPLPLAGQASTRAQPCSYAWSLRPLPPHRAWSWVRRRMIPRCGCWRAGWRACARSSGIVGGGTLRAFPARVVPCCPLPLCLWKQNEGGDVQEFKN